jgi:hypothetical protein
MPETGGANVEISQRLQEAGKPTALHSSRFEEGVEIIEAVVLALVAIATAWSGYQAARWEGNRAELYGESSRLRVTAEGLAALAGQERLYDTTTFNSWLNAGSRGDRKLAQFLERRFREEFRTAFRAWLTTDPFNDPTAAPGPTFIPEYRNAKAEQAETLSGKALSTFNQGTASGATGDRYVRVTVLLATVLLLTAISQRFRITVVRIGLLCSAFVVLAIPLWNLFTLPRL